MSNSVKSPWGQGVLQAVAAIRQGVWVQTCGDYWNTNDIYPSYPGYDGWNGTQHRSYHDALVSQMIASACGAPASTQSVAVMYNDNVNYAWGTQFRDGLTRIGCNVTLFAGPSGWRGCDPRNFDVVIGAISGYGNHPITNAYGNIVLQAIDLCKNYNCRFISSEASTGPNTLKTDFGIGTQVIYTSGYWVTNGWNPASATPPHPRHVFQESPYSAAGIGMISYTDYRLEDGFTPASGSLNIYHSTHATVVVPQGEGMVAVWRA